VDLNGKKTELGENLGDLALNVFDSDGKGEINCYLIPVSSASKRMALAVALIA
jgi:hypothetical protein